MADENVEEGELAAGLEESELTADEILTFGPCVEAVAWGPMWLQERRAPIAVAAGRARLGRVFNEDGIGRAVVIRPCLSRGRRVRGLPPVYTPAMLQANSGVYDGWPMFMDHVPPELVERLARYGRSVRDLGGQILRGWWDGSFSQESDHEFGYQRGATLAEIWATPLIRGTVGENPNLLHTSINAWPRSGKPGPVPWRPATKGMIIEGIRRVPAGSVDYVVRGGAGGKLLVQEGLDGEGVWPMVGEWNADDVALVVSVADGLYAAAQMPTLPRDPNELRAFLQEEAPHLLPALQESAAAPAPSGASAQSADALSETRVRDLITEALSGQPTVEEFESQIEERTQEMLRERDEQRRLASVAAQLIENAQGIPRGWKPDLKRQFAVMADGPAAGLLVEAEMDGETVVKSADEVLTERVRAALDHTRELVAEAQGKPRVRDEGGAKPDAAGGESGKTQEGQTPYWRERFSEMGIAGSDKVVETLYGEGEG